MYATSADLVKHL